MAYILIVDDDFDGTEALVQHLRRDGHGVDHVPNGREALEAILARAPDLVILDIRMPEMDGIGLLEILRSYLRLSSLPVVTLAAHYSDHDMEKANALGVLKVFRKATDGADEVRQWVAEYFGSSSIDSESSTSASS